MTAKTDPIKTRAKNTRAETKERLTPAAKLAAEYAEEALQARTKQRQWRQQQQE